jgi:hypothetical protein
MFSRKGRGIQYSIADFCWGIADYLAGAGLPGANPQSEIKNPK